MTDIIDYQIDDLELSVFEHSNGLQTADTKGDSYLDLISLICLLTQSNEINYQIIADFFLTYRSFISQNSLLRILLLRIKWCLSSISDSRSESKQNIGKLTLVRTFVMIRHWLLNYFTDDFIPSIELRRLFITSVNDLKHYEIFVQRIIGNLKRVWTQCCNKSWDEDLKPEDYYLFDIKIGPQGYRYKRLSAFTLNQQNDPFTRNSAILSTFDKDTVHKLPMPLNQPATSTKVIKRQPKMTLNPKNSSYRLSQVGSNKIKVASDMPPEKNPLYVSLNSNIDTRSRNTIRDSIEFPKIPNLSKVIPPTPVKKMDIKIPTPPVSKHQQQQKGLKPLIETLLKSFHRNNVSLKDTTYQENFIKTVASVAKVENLKLEALAEGKFDILSAHTIEELEYLVRFHNKQLNKYGTKIDQSPIKDSFNFSIDEPYENILNNAPFTKGTSKIGNMNICKTISNTSRSAISLQQINEQASYKSYTSYDSLYSGRSKSLNNLFDLKRDKEAGLRKKSRVSNFREFNFEKEPTEEPVYRSSLSRFPSSILSESTPNQIVLESDSEHDAQSAIHTTRSPAQDSQETVLFASSQTSIKGGLSDITKPIDRVTFVAKNEVSKVEVQESELAKQANIALLITNKEEFYDSYECLDSRKSKTPSLGDQDYNEIGSFVFSYKDTKEADERSERSEQEEETENQASPVSNEPSTPPATAVNDGLISSGIHVSPIRPITEEHIFNKPSLEYQESQEPSLNDLYEDSLDLNRVPSFNRLSNGSVITRTSYAKLQHLHRQISYISQRSKRASGFFSNSSTFSGIEKNTNIVNVAVKSEAIDQSIQDNDVPIDFSKNSLRAPNSKSISLVCSIDSNEYDIPYPGVNSEVIAELAGITDGSLQDDPITNALLRLEGQYKPKKSKECEEQFDSLFDSRELSRQVNSLIIQPSIPRTQKQLNRNSFSLKQRRKTRIFSLTPVEQKNINQDSSSSKLLLDLLLNRQLDNGILKVSNTEQHISFILNFDSKTIAEQFTIIERDVLLEVDWKELVQLKWDSTNLVPINSWLEVLIQNEDIQGVDLCISRFNLTVNWIVSEILLTKDITLRKLTIQRFIHVAQHCKDIQNYSTLMQVLLALGSDKVLKLKETWRGVEPGDILTYKNLESIASPLKNFLTLRNQLNKLKPSIGCIPFLGLYLSDLLFNKEKNSSLGNKINFGKFRHDSKIVRSLIQCIQWSTLYNIEVNDEVLSKCLYIKSLTEEEMIECLESLK